MIISTFSSLKISKDKIYKNKQRKKIIISTFSSVLQKVFGKIDHEAKFPRLVLSVPRPSSARFLLFSSLATCGGIRTDSRRSYRIARLSSIPWLAMESRIVYGDTNTRARASPPTSSEFCRNTDFNRFHK